MATFKPAYLIHGDDHGRIGERRARLRALAEAAGGAQGVEGLEGDAATPDAVAGALAAMTFALGRRFIIVDGAERWKDREMGGLEAALAAMPPETTVAFFAREDGRLKAPERLHAAVRKAGGDVAAEQSVKPRELPRWAAAQARALGLTLSPEAARLLVGQVGERQQRLLRELEKLALFRGEPGEVDVGLVEMMAASSSETKAWSLADAIVAGDTEAAARLYLTLRAQGERLAGLLFAIARRVVLAYGVVRALDAGQPESAVRRGLPMPSFAADRLIADARRAGSERLRQAVLELADLELASRGGAAGVQGEDTATLRALARLAA